MNDSVTSKGIGVGPAGAADTEHPAIGLVRRIRRRSRLSQRQLADRLGIPKSTIARWESGQSSPTVEQLERAAGVAGLRIALVDAEDQLVPPMRPDGVQDRAGRRLPPYADPRARGWHTETDSLDAGWWRDVQEARELGQVRVSFHRRALSDTREERAAKGLPDDHPTYVDLVDQMDRQEYEREVRAVAWQLRREILARKRAG